MSVVDMDPKMSTEAYVVWTDLCVHAVKVKRDKSSRPILIGATGYAEPGSIMAIMGPSGSGKSTLLNALAGRLSPNTVLTGDILLNGEKKSSLSYGTAAYVTQEDFLIGTLTVRESVMYSANLRFAATIGTKEKNAIVDRAILEMGLAACQNTYVGNYFMRGLSGGEKRRLSIALQILTRPRLLFLDEPTSGLDSAAAYFVVRTLKNLAKDGQTVISAIHQPSSEVFALFDDLTLLSGGQTIYFGEAARASEFFAASNFACPPMQNPADHYLQIINADFDTVKSNLKALGHIDSDEETADPLLLKSRKSTEEVVKILSTSYQHSEYIIAARAKITEILSNTSGIGGFKGGSNHRAGASFFRQCMTLTSRSFTNMSRDLGYYWIRLLMYVATAMCLGTIFWKVGLEYSSIVARAAVMFFVAGFLTFLSICGFPAFVEDMRVFYHERVSGHYGVAAFVVSNTLSSTPFVFLIAFASGTIVYFMTGLHPGIVHYVYFILVLFASLKCVESSMMAVASLIGHNFLAGLVIGAGLQGVSMMLAGYFRLAKDLPKPVWRYPGSYLSLHAYAIQGLFKNDFRGLTFKNIVGQDDNPIGPAIPGTFVLRHFLGVDSHRGMWADLGIIFAMIAANKILFFIFIKISEKLGPRFRLWTKEYFCSHCISEHKG